MTDAPDPSTTAPDDGATTTQQAGPPPAAGRLRTVLLGLGLLVAVLVAAVVVVAVRDVRAHGEASSLEQDQVRREQLITAAEQQALNVTGLSASNVDANLAFIQDNGTGNFLSDAKAQAAGVKAAVTQQRIVATSEVVDSAVVSADDQTGTVLVIVNGTVQNASTTTPVARRYRLQLQLDRVDGRWLTSTLQLVQAGGQSLTGTASPTPSASAPAASATPGSR